MQNHNPAKALSCWRRGQAWGSLFSMIEVAESRRRNHRFSAEVIIHAVWLYFRFPLSLRMVVNMLVVRGIVVSHETIRRWAEKFGRFFANTLRQRALQVGDKW